MKKAVSLLLALSMLFVLCACGTSENSPKPTPAPTPTIQQIEITLDNWNEYFEIIDHIAWEQNDFGEYVHYYLVNAVCVREEYRNYISFDNSDVRFGYDLNTSWYEVSVDYSNQTIEIGKLIPGNSREEKPGTFNIGNGFYTDRRVPPNTVWAYGYTNLYENWRECTDEFSINRVEGTLTLEIPIQ